MTNDELEQRLRAWYRTDVDGGERAPASLRASVRAIPGANRVRALPFGGRRGSVVLIAAAIVMALAIAGAIAVGAGIVRLSTILPAPSLPEASLALGPTPQPSRTAASPSASPAPSPGVPPAQGMFVDLDQYLLAGDSVGWVTTSSGVFRTIDLGSTWTRLHPPDWQPGAKTSLIDAETMYSAAGVRPAKIDATHDGGVSWVEATIDDPMIDSLAVMSFQSPSTGYVTFWDVAGSGRLRVYGTDDGGLTWSGPALGVVPALPYNFGKLDEPPLGGVLWQSNGKPDNKPFDNRLLLSMDGGATWKDRTYPVGTFAPKGDVKYPTGIWLGSGRIVLGIRDNDAAYSVWSSTDDARTWQFINGWADPRGFGADLVSPSEWIFFAQDGAQIRSTVDAGAHWRTIVGTSPVTLDVVSFASPDLGWGFNVCRDSIPRDGACDLPGDQSAFYVTTDGGRTWTRIGR